MMRHSHFCLFSSQLYQTFDKVLLLAHGRALYSGAGGLAPARYFSSRGIQYPEGYNVADYLLDIASDPPVGLFQSASAGSSKVAEIREDAEKEPCSEVLALGNGNGNDTEKGQSGTWNVNSVIEEGKVAGGRKRRWLGNTKYATTFLTQLEVLSDREWKILCR